MAKGFSGPPGNMQALMKQAQKMQQDLQRVQEDVQSFTAEAASGGGMVTVMVNGKNEIQSLKIDPKVVNAEDVEMLQDLIIAASNEALRKVQEDVRTQIEKITGGISIPGLF